MNYVDILILLFLLFGAFRGFCKGMIVEIATLLGLLLGVYIAVKYSVYTEKFLRDFFNIYSRYLSYIALTLTFILVAIVIYLLGKMLTGVANMMALGLMNKLLGSLFGIAKYFVIVCVLLLIFDALDDKFRFIEEEAKQKSLLFYPFLNFAQKIYNSIRF